MGGQLIVGGGQQLFTGSCDRYNNLPTTPPCPGACQHNPLSWSPSLTQRLSFLNTADISDQSATPALFGEPEERGPMKRAQKKEKEPEPEEEKI